MSGFPDKTHFIATVRVELQRDMGRVNPLTATETELRVEVAVEGPELERGPAAIVHALEAAASRARNLLERDR